MTNKTMGIRAWALLLAALLLSHSTVMLAGDKDDVLKVVEKWAALESDLDAQAKLIRDDRIQIFEMTRQTDQATNLRIQKAQADARRQLDPKGQLIATIESPITRIYGNTAVVSFVRHFFVIPGNASPRPPNASFITLVLVKDGGKWGIAHLHGSTS